MRGVWRIRDSYANPRRSLKANNNYNPVNLHDFFLIERRHATRKFSSALFRVLLGSIGPLYRCINCIGKILLKILSLVLVCFRAVCFPRPRSAFSRSAVFGVCFRDTLQVYRPVVNRCFVVTPLTYHRRSTDTPLTYHRLLSYTLSTVLNV